MASIMSMVNYADPESLGSRLRRRRLALVRHMIDAIFREKGAVRVLDIGGRREYWRLFDDAYLHERNVHVTLLNYDAAQLDTTAEKSFASEQGDACDLTRFGDNAFDLTHSNSTIEHVGDWPRMEAFARETRRIARAYYCQTPYFWFPVEPHFLLPVFHWLPDGLRAKMLVANMAPHKGKSADIGDAMRRVQGARLLDRAQMRFLFPDAKIQFESLGPLPKSLIAMRQC